MSDTLRYTQSNLLNLYRELRQKTIAFHSCLFTWRRATVFSAPRPEGQGYINASTYMTIEKPDMTSGSPVNPIG